MLRLLILFCCLPLLVGAPKTGRTSFHIPVWIDEAETGLDSGTLSPTQKSSDSFNAKLEGDPARVLSVRGPEDDLLLLVVLDTVGDIGFVGPAKSALIAEIEKLPSNVHVGLMRAQDGLRVLADPTNDRAIVTAAIREAAVSGNAGLLDTAEVVEGLADSILTKSGVRVAVFYVTDSNIYNYREDYTNPVVNPSTRRGDMSRRFPEGLVREKITSVMNKLDAMQAPLFIVHLEYRTDRLNEAYQSGLMQLSATTGGRSIFCRSTSEIQTAIAETVLEITSHYSVDLQLPDETLKTVRVELESPAGTLSYRERFSPQLR